MMINAIEGIVENGRIRLRDHGPLPEQTKVYVIVVDAVPVAPGQVRTPRLARPEQAVDFRKQVVEVRGDAKL